MAAKKFRKSFRPNFQKHKVFNSIGSGKFAIICTEDGVVNQASVEAVRKIIAKRSNREALLINKMKGTEIPITKKSLGVRMGSGKGDIDHYATYVKKGQIIFTISGVSSEVMNDIALSASKKLSVRTVCVEKPFIF